MEIFKDVKGYDGIYQISNNGTLKVLLKFRKYRKYNEKILNPIYDKDGYLRTRLTKNKIGKMAIIHRLVAITFIPNPDNKPCVNHINGIKPDNRVENLEWVTILENNLHAIKLGLKKPLYGENHNMVKVTLAIVNEIRDNKNKLFQKELAEKYGISQTQVNRIINNKQWIKNELSN